MIYLVEDDAGIRELEAYALRAAGFGAAGFERGDNMFSELAKELPELIILDIMLPDDDGVKILERLKSNSRTNKIPVIMATAKGAEYDKVKTLDMGADDYLVKPFGMLEMVSRVRAVLRRSADASGAETLSAGDISMNLAEHSVSVKGRKVPLTLKEYELLRTLLSRPNVVFTRDMLLSEVWNTDYAGETRTVDVHMQSLRQKLGDGASALKTVRGVGYRAEA